MPGQERWTPVRLRAGDGMDVLKREIVPHGHVQRGHGIEESVPLIEREQVGVLSNPDHQGLAREDDSAAPGPIFLHFDDRILVPEAWTAELSRDVEVDPAPGLR